jgi:hypothetical protein
MTRVFGVSGSSMLSWRRDQELSPNKVLQTDGLLRHSRCRRRPLLA